MTRRHNLALLVLIALSMGGVFQLKYSMVALKSEVARINADLEEERWRMRTLEADWAYLTRPDRLVAQAQALGMTRAGVTRIVDIERIGRRKQLELSRRPMPITLPSGGSAEFRVKPIATFEIAAGGSGR